MRKLLFVCFLSIGFMLNAQVKTPQPSPLSKIEQKVGLTDVSIEYSRPSMKGRTIFGDLVPYGKLWRLGANANTKVSFSDDVTIDGTTLKAGEYAIFATPNAGSWEITFYTDATNWGTPRNWDDAKVALKTTAKVIPVPMKIETFTITFDDLTNSSAVIGMLWENAYVGVTFEVPTDKGVTASIESVMAGPSAGDYFSAARYYLQENKDINEAKEWIDEATKMTKDKPRFWYLRLKSLIYAKAGKTRKAIKIAEESLALAEKAGNADYVKMNKASIAEWSK